MSEPKWTPGPWKVEKTVGGWSITCSSFPMAESPLTKLMDFDDEAESDAHLIAAAPELYEALESASQALAAMDCKHAQAHASKLVAVLAKARGES